MVTLEAPDFAPSPLTGEGGVGEERESPIKSALVQELERRIVSDRRQ